MNFQCHQLPLITSMFDSKLLLISSFYLLFLRPVKKNKRPWKWYGKGMEKVWNLNSIWLGTLYTLNYMFGTTAQDVKKKWSLQTGGHYRQVQFAWNSVVDWIFHRMENGLSRQDGLSRGGPSRQVLLWFHLTLVKFHCDGLMIHIVWKCLFESEFWGLHHPSQNSNFLIF